MGPDVSLQPVQFAVTLVTPFEIALIGSIDEMDIRVTPQVGLAYESFETLVTLVGLVVCLPKGIKKIA